MMEFLFLFVLLVMLLLFGYAQWQRGVIRTPGRIILDEEDEIEIHLIR